MTTRRPARLTALLTAAVILSGCASAEPTDTDNCDPGPTSPLDPARKVLVAGRLQAVDLGNQIVVSASGTHPSTSWKTELEAATAADGTPVLTLYGEPPTGPAGQAITRFYVSAAVKPTARRVVTIRDADGLHEVPIRCPTK